MVNIDDADIKAYVAISSEEESEAEQPEKKFESSSDEEGATEKDRIAKYRNLLAEITKTEETEKKKKGEIELEFSWDVGLQEKAEKLVQKKVSEKNAETPWEQQLAKRREKRKSLKQQKKSEEIEIGVSSDEEEDDDNEDDIPSDVDMNDPYFREEFETKEFRKTANKKQKNAKGTLQPEDPEKAAQLELLLMDENDDKHHFNFKKIVKEQESKGQKGKKTKNQPIDDKSESKDDFQVRNFSQSLFKEKISFSLFLCNLKIVMK